MPRKLSDTRVRILRRLASRDIDRDGAECAKEISVALGHRASEWANGPLREMARAHPAPLVRGLGVTDNNAATWAITDAGREELAKAEALAPSP